MTVEGLESRAWLAVEYLAGRLYVFRVYGLGFRV